MDCNGLTTHAHGTPNPPRTRSQGLSELLYFLVLAASFALWR